MRQALEAASVNVKKHEEGLRQENAQSLQAICADKTALDFFTEFSFDDEIKIGQFTFYQANCLKKNFSWDEDFKRAAKANLLLVGSGLSGDMVTLDLLNFQAGILFHDYFWEEADEGLRKFFIKMNCSLGQFYLNSVQVPDYPIDAYEAASFMNSPFTGYAEDL